MFEILASYDGVVCLSQMQPLAEKLSLSTMPLYDTRISNIRDMVVERWNRQFGCEISNHTSHQKVYFNELVADALRDNMDMIFFDLRGCGGC